MPVGAVLHQVRPQVPQQIQQPGPQPGPHPSIGGQSNMLNKRVKRRNAKRDQDVTFVQMGNCLH
jgi:hypothetical protein